MLLKKQRQDLRSLATFRALLGIYILYDIWSRLKHGRISLSCYTSSTPTSFLHPNDTPHKSPLHLIWFYRGSETIQIFFFVLTGVLAIFYSLGFSGYYSKSKSKSKSKSNNPSPVFVAISILLWFNVVAMQCRNMHVHDGSDTFCRHLLLWSCFLPMNRVWSLDAFLLQKEGLKKQQTQQAKIKQNGEEYENEYEFNNTCTTREEIPQQQQQQQQKHFLSTKIDNNLAVWGLRLQVVFMYLGTIMARTIDIYGYSFHQLSKSEWLPPSLTAVYYSLNASFSTRDVWLGDVVRNNITLSRIMTLFAMLIETFAPIACLIMGIWDNGSTRGNNKYAFLPPLLLFKLHFGLLLLMNLPNWQFVGMIATTIWIPTSVWNNWQRKLSLWFPLRFAPPLIPQTLEMRQKKDIVGKVTSADSNCTSTHSFKMSRNHATSTRKKCIYNLRSTIVSFLTYFFFGYMIYNFAGERTWIRKHDNGDVGEFLRFSQHWVMFSSAPKTSVHDIFTGTVRLRNETSINEMVEVDVWEWMKDGQMIEIDVKARRNEIWNNMTHIYPNPRFERLFSQWSTGRNSRALNYFLKKICILGPFENLTFIWQHLKVLDPSIQQRYQKSEEDTIFHVNCQRKEILS